MGRLERLPVHLEREDDLPVGARLEVPDLHLPVHDQGQGGALHAAHGEEVLAPALGGDGQESGEGGPPRQVHRLAGLGGRRQVVVHLFQVPERRLHVRLREGAEAGPLDLQVVPDLPEEVQGLHSDELPLPVEVGGDDDSVLSVHELLEGGGDVLHPHGLHRGDVHELRRVHLVPVVVLVRVVELDDVAAEGGDGVVAATAVEREDGHAPQLRAFQVTLGQDLGDPPSGAVLLCDDQDFHGPRPSWAFLFNRLLIRSEADSDHCRPPVEAGVHDPRR